MTLAREVKGGGWEVWLDDRKVAVAASRTVAMNQVDRPYRRGHAEIINTKTGEAWARRAGSWHQTLETAGQRADALPMAQGGA